MPLPPPNASGSSFGVADANNKSAAVAVPCCSSSSSDEAETDPNGAGWPSVVSVLETPDRRRVRKSLRAVVAASTSTSSSAMHVNNLTHASTRPAVAPAILVRSPQRKRPALAAAPAPNVPTVPLMLFTSPPQPPARKARLHSPTLRTPKCSRPSDAARHVHLSRSPMSAFFIRLAAARPPVAGGDCSPKSASSSSSSSAASTSSASPAAASVLMPLNMHNYIGIRFSGEQPDGVRRQVRLAAANASSSSSGTTDENATPPLASSASGPRKSSASASDDSGFLDASCSSASTDRSATMCTTTTTLIETPSKGLARTSDASTSAEAASCSSASSSTHFLLSELDQHHRLMSSIHHHHHSPHSTASIIAEQSYGPLEASVLDGILNDLSMWPSSPRKTPAKPTRSSPTQHRRCSSSAMFEAKLAALAAPTVLPNPPPSTASSSSSSWSWSCSPRAIPSSLLVELDEEEEAGDHHDHGDEEEAETAQPHNTFDVLFPDLDQRALDHMFGTSADQLEMTRMAHEFLQRARSGVLSAGVPAGFSAHCRLRLD